MDQKFIDVLLGNIYDPSLQLPDPELVQYYQDLENRTIWIDGEVDASLFSLVSKIIQWNREDRVLSIKDRKPIKIFVNSAGGELDIADTVCSVIKLSRTPVYGFALGICASAASLIFLSCHKRYALPNAYWIFHRGSISNMGGNFNEIQAAMDDYRQQIEKMEKFYIENTNYPEEIVREKIKTDWYVHVPEALKYGVVTDLIENISVML